MKKIVFTALTIFILTIGTQVGFAKGKEICLQGGGGDFVRLTGGQPDKKPYAGSYTDPNAPDGLFKTPVIASATKNTDGTYKLSIMMLDVSPVKGSRGVWIWQVYNGDKDFNGNAYYQYSLWLPNGDAPVPDHLTNVECSTLEPGSGPTCGNAKCEDGETPNSCSQDCKVTGPVCGNGKCEQGENSNSCPQDCKPQPQCHPCYTGSNVCLNPNASDVDCGEIPWKNFHACSADPYGLDGDNDGIACES